jgi:hypothetical protein
MSRESKCHTLCHLIKVNSGIHREKRNEDYLLKGSHMKFHYDNYLAQ